MTAIQLSRKFRIGAVLLNDPAPDKSPEEAVREYVATYPHIANCRVEEAGVEGDALVFNVVKPPAQTKGNGEDDEHSESLMPIEHVEVKEVTTEDGDTEIRVFVKNEIGQMIVIAAHSEEAAARIAKALTEDAFACEAVDE